MLDSQSTRIKVEPEYITNNSPASWVHCNRVLFPSFIKQAFKNNKHATLFSHQSFIKDYMQFDSPYRGVLLYHGLGVGKTCASIAASEVLLRKGLDVVVMLPASLEQNFRSEIQKCGNKWYRLQQRWKFIEAGSSDAADIAALNISKAVLKANKGVWVPSTGADSILYSAMNSIQQQQITKQVNSMIDHHYQFISYNGQSTASVNKLTKEGTFNPFDNKLVIIDEVHNFISRVMHGVIAKKLYSKLMEARNAKIIMLSGTPVINQPSELAYIINLAHGYNKVYKLRLLKGGKYDPAAVSAYLETSRVVDTFTLRDDINELSIVLTPEGFGFSDTKTKALTRLPQQQDSLEAIIAGLETLGVRISKTTSRQPSYHTILPLDKAFNEMFIDFANLGMKNPIMLARRLQGFVSYYENYPESLYPRQTAMQIVHTPLSALQLSKYAEVRVREREIEERAKKHQRRRNKDEDGNDVFNSAAGVYRTFSRAVCNFVFPEGIDRPYPSKVKELYDKRKQEVDVADDDYNLIREAVDDGEEEDDENLAESLDKNQLYTKLIGTAMKKLAKHPTALSSQLEDHSPKMKKIITTVMSSPGTCLVYSQFRSVEGLGVLALALEAHGFVELKLRNVNKEWVFDIPEKDYTKPKYIVFHSNNEDTKILMDIFNSDYDSLPPGIRNRLSQMHSIPRSEKNLHGSIAKVIMITQSGSEGISLKNVRQVHILEPYWNDIRIQQVIGRAVRAHSHHALKPAEREVSVYMYLSTLTSAQLEKNYRLKTSDRGITSDEHIYAITQKKKRIVDGLLSIVKEAAVDCYLHNAVHKNVKCFKYPDNMDPSQLSHQIDIKEDETDDQYNARTRTSVQKKKVTLTVATSNGIKYVLNKDTGVLYDHKVFNENKTLQRVGQLVDNKVVLDNN